MGPNTKLMIDGALGGVIAAGGVLLTAFANGTSLLQVTAGAIITGVVVAAKVIRSRLAPNPKEGAK